MRYSISDCGHFDAFEFYLFHFCSKFKVVKCNQIELNKREGGYCTAFCLECIQIVNFCDFSESNMRIERALSVRMHYAVAVAIHSVHVRWPNNTRTSVSWSGNRVSVYDRPVVDGCWVPPKQFYCHSLTFWLCHCIRISGFMWCGLFMMNSNDTSDRAHTKTHWNFYFRFWIRLNFISLLRQRPARFYYMYSSTEFRSMWRLIFIVVIINELRLIENYVNSGRDRLTSECRDESMVIQQMIILLFFACRWYNHYIVFSNSFFPLFLLLVPHECVGRDEIVNWMNAIRLALMPKVIKINLFWKSRRVWDLIARDDGARMFFDAPQTSGEWQHVAGRISALSLGAIRAQY